jgi:hypothetical protein
MSQIVYNQMQLIVEKAMRDAGLKGDFEDGWKSIIVDGSGQQIQNKYNFQNMRDATAQAILDALTGVTVTGSLSVGTTQGVQVKTGNSSQVNLSTQSVALPALAQPAARVGDSIVIDNAIFLAWIVNITAAVNSLSSGAVPVVPAIVDGKITSGSTGVSISDVNVQIGS